MLAAIGNDGTRDVVLGVGHTEDEAKKDAAFLIKSMSILLSSDPLTISRYTEITTFQANRVKQGITDCKMLGIQPVTV